MATITISADAFTNGGRIPAKFTCEGQDISPALKWSKPPEGTQSQALIVDDPDAPGEVFTHWIALNLPAGVTNLPEGVPATARLSNGAVQFQNDFGRLGWCGPCPPPGKPHHYRFLIYALDTIISLPTRSSRKEIHDAMQGHVLAQGQLTGIYQR